MPVCCRGAYADASPPTDYDAWAFGDGQKYVDKNSRSLSRRKRRPSNKHTAAQGSWGRGPRAVASTPGVVANTQAAVAVDMSSTASCAAPTDGSSSWSLRGALSSTSSPVHRALVLVLGLGDQHINKRYIVILLYRHTVFDI